MPELADNVIEMPLSPVSPESPKRSGLRKAGLIAGGAGLFVAGLVVAETVMPVYITPIRGKACPSERERNLAEEYRNMRRASKKAAKTDSLLKQATKKERKGEYDKAERLVTTAADMAAEADQMVRDSDEAAAKRGSYISGLRKTATNKLEQVRTLKEKAAPHPSDKTEPEPTKPEATEGSTEGATAA